MSESLPEPKKIHHPSFRIQHFLEYGLYLFVFLLPWQTKLILRQGTLAGGDWEYGTISLYGIDILLILLLIVFAIKLFSEKKNRGDNVLNSTKDLKSSEVLDPSSRGLGTPWPGRQDDKKDRIVVIILSGLDLFVFLSIFFAPDTVLALYRYVLFLLGLGLFWLLVKTEYDKRKMAVAFLAALLVQAVIAIGQFLTQLDPASKWLGMAAHSAANLGDSVVEDIGTLGAPERWLRAYGSLDHPNILGGLLAFGLVIAIFYFISRKSNGLSGNKIVSDSKTDSSAPREARFGRNDKKILITYFLIITLFVGLIFTFSRSAFLALVIGMIIFLIGSWAGKNRSSLKKLGGIILLLAVIFGIIFINYGNLLLTRSSVDSRLEMKSISERRLYFDDSLRLLKKDWLLGAGIGNYTKALAVKEPQRPWYGLNPVHNVFLLVWSEIGIGGFLFFLALLIYLVARSGREKNILSLSILAILVIIMMLDHYLWSLHFGVLFFWLSLGFVYKNL
jgi:hypothetical protein